MHISYRPDDEMFSLVADNCALIHVIARFGIPIGFGEKSVETVCRENGVDCSTFLAVVNFVANGESAAGKLPAISIASLMDYLKSSHRYFIDHILPSIRCKLTKALNVNHSDVSFLIIKLFDEVASEIRLHMEFEERNVFDCLGNLESLDQSAPSRIEVYSDSHDHVSGKLTELKNLIIRYSPENADRDLLNEAIMSIYACEEELLSHCRIEDSLLVPSILIEKSF